MIAHLAPLNSKSALRSMINYQTITSAVVDRVGKLVVAIRAAPRRSHLANSETLAVIFPYQRIGLRRIRSFHRCSVPFDLFSKSNRKNADE